MELPRSQLGRRPSAADSGSPRPDAEAFVDQGASTSTAIPSSPLLGVSSPLMGSPASPRMGSTPRTCSTPRTQHRHKSSETSQAALSPTLLWSTIFTGNMPTLPFAGGPASRGTSRPFYDGRSSPDGRPPLTPAFLRNLALRPLYVLSRRGPLLPVVAALIFLVFFLTSTWPSSQSVKLRVQGAVGPYIPQRAADAINWRGNHWGPDDDSRRGRRLPKAVVPAGIPLGGGPAVLPPPRKDGRLLLEEGKTHPIPALMKRAKAQWEHLKGKQSQTFEQAVKEYVRRYGRRPPKGFDKWYAFAKSHKVLLIDEFDLIDKDLLMYRAFTPPAFRARVAHIPTVLDNLWTIRIEKGKIFREGQLAEHDRAIGVVSLTKRFVHALPDMTIVYNGHDSATIAVAAEERMRLEKLARMGEFDEDGAPPFWPKEVGPEPHWGMPIFCPPGSAVREPDFDYGWPPMDSTGLEMPTLTDNSVGSLLEDFKGYMDVCNSPQYRHFHCTTSWVFPHHPTAVMPIFTPGVQTTSGDIHSLIVEQLELESPHDPTWEERPFTSLQWRGQTSGPLWESKSPWKSTQRARLHLLSHHETGSRKIVLTDENDKMRVEEVPNYRLNPLFLDTGMVGPAVQCVQQDGTCDAMYKVFQGYDKRISFDRASLYKYVLDVDGNSWSGRFRRLMLSNAAVVKATIFPEFWTDWAIPWLHYIPMQVDYSDMWDVLAFFRGGINGEGAHDALGKEIAEAGKEWVRLCYRWADLEAYQYRLLLEYGRLYNDATEPGSNDFNGDETVEPVWSGPIKMG